MTIYEALKFSSGIIEELRKAGANPDDYKYVALYEDFQNRRKTGEKICYIVACLASEYKVSERTVYDIVKRLGNDCKCGSV